MCKRRLRLFGCWAYICCVGGNEVWNYVLMVSSLMISTDLCCQPGHRPGRELVIPELSRALRGVGVLIRLTICQRQIQWQMADASQESILQCWMLGH